MSLNQVMASSAVTGSLDLDASRSPSLVAVTVSARAAHSAAGEALHRLLVGAKSEPLGYDEVKDVLYMGGGSGIVQFTFEELLGPPSAVAPK